MKPKVLIIVEGGVAEAFYDGDQVDVAILDIDSLQDGIDPDRLPPVEFDYLCPPHHDIQAIRAECVES